MISRKKNADASKVRWATRPFDVNEKRESTKTIVFEKMAHESKTHRWTTNPTTSILGGPLYSGNFGPLNIEVTNYFHLWYWEHLGTWVYTFGVPKKMYIFENKHYIPLKNDSWKTASSLGWSLLNGYVTFLRCATCFLGKHSNPSTDIIDSMIIAFFKWKMKSTFAPTHTYQKNNAFSCVNNLKFRNMAKIDVNFFLPQNTRIYVSSFETWHVGGEPSW